MPDHGNQPHYTDNGDGTIIDNVTGLMWQKSPDTDGDGDIDAADKHTYDEAVAGAGACTQGGYTDWRLPNIRELESLVDYSRAAPAIDDGVFDCQSAGYWSSTSLSLDAGIAWIVHFHDGMTNYSTKVGGFLYYVRAVRSLP